MIDQIINKKQFSEIVEQKVREKRMTYMDAVLTTCEEKMIDPMDVASLVSASIKDHIEAEAVANRMIQGGNTLPI